MTLLYSPAATAYGFDRSAYLALALPSDRKPRKSTRKVVNKPHPLPPVSPPNPPAAPKPGQPERRAVLALIDEITRTVGEYGEFGDHPPEHDHFLVDLKAAVLAFAVASGQEPDNITMIEGSLVVTDFGDGVEWVWLHPNA